MSFILNMKSQKEAFQVKKTIRRNLERKQREATRRTERATKSRSDSGRPTLPNSGPTYEVAGRARGLVQGGIGLVHELVVFLGLAVLLDDKVKVLKVHRPYHESDHILNIAYNVMCGGRTLDDIELRRNDPAYLDALGVEMIPDPTTAGDFCRRFSDSDIEALMESVNDARLKVWRLQGPAFTKETARIDVDGSLVPTNGECKEGMALTYTGVWGYHPLLVSLANTQEPLFIVNRSGSRPSHEGAAPYLDKAIALCRSAGFTDVLLRGDTDFSQTAFLDGWNADGVRFVFGYDARKNLVATADNIDEGDFSELERRANRAFVEADKRRARQPRIKEAVVRSKGYKNIRLRSEEVAEFDYSPIACRDTYRMVVLRKNLTVESGETALFDQIRYFFYITNDRDMTAKQVVAESNDRCNQENLIATLKGGVRALHAPLNTLNANWVYMVMASLAWSLKAWMALMLPISARWRERHEAERNRWLQMDFRTFLNEVILVPAQVVRSGRRIILRLLAWRPQLRPFLRLAAAL